MHMSATLAANEAMEDRRRRGERVVPMAFGEVGLPIHPLLREELSAAARYTDYGPVAGTARLRTAVAGYWERRGLSTDPGVVVVAPGSKPLLYALRLAIGGDVILPRPSWVSYAAQADMLGGLSWSVPTLPGEGGVPDPEATARAVGVARSAGREIRQVVVTLPDNPTGSTAAPETVRALSRVARDLDLMIVSDEIYRDLLHSDDTPYASPAQFAPERTVVTTGLSKNLALGGWRVGAARFPDSPRGHRLRSHVLGIASETWSTPPQPMQYAAVPAFDEDPHLAAYIELATRLHGRVASAVATRWQAWGSQPFAPTAAFYVYPDLGAHRSRLARTWGVTTSAELAALLLERYGIGVLPGEVFGECGSKMRLRLATSLLYGRDDDERTAAMEAVDALELPWISKVLDFMDESLADLLATGANKR